jgi:FkbM family methyltransferase
MDTVETPRALLDAWRGPAIRTDGAVLHVPGTRRIRLSVVAGNLRIRRLLRGTVRPGSVVVDVGANIGYNAVHAARLAGAGGRVIAVEPTPDNLAVLHANVAACGLANVAVEPVAAGRTRAFRELYVRGDTSAVNSLFSESCYAHVTSVLEVRVVPLDDLVTGTADVVKIDVEGAELEVLHGMTRLLREPRTVLIVEWHPLLQQMAGFGPDELPRWLIERGFRLRAVSHTTERPLAAEQVPALTTRLLRRRGPVELLASRAE